MAKSRKTTKTTHADSAGRTTVQLKARRSNLEDRKLLSPEDALRTEGLFKMLANDTRIRLLHHLVRSREASVGDIANALDMKPQAVSNQLQRLSDTGMVASRREGVSVFYRVKNGCVAPLLDLALCLMDAEGCDSASR
ncbi:ArsR/SmtB family transcription factor [Paludisphaera soli]|uniref:ArsR/SmtB family transcription factor n=1 Tax=Paludisphaera soli TaxID=2712865 RepID=UPI0013EC5D58|nr:metalloregulator ArsR/SmtB family transcription factor [Paludisphaera soli]